MATTNEFKKLNQNGHRVFISNIGRSKTRVTIVNNPDARNMNDGGIVFQQTYNSWRDVPDADVSRAYRIVGVIDPADATTM